MKIPIREAKGLTIKLVPMTRSMSAWGKSDCALRKKSSGRFSPADQVGSSCRDDSHRL